MRHERPSSSGEARSSALWGKGSGGQSRGSALWGRGGRSVVALLVLVVSVIIPAAGIAGEKQRANVPADLIAAARANPDATFKVIIQRSESSAFDRAQREDADEAKSQWDSRKNSFETKQRSERQSFDNDKSQKKNRNSFDSRQKSERNSFDSQLNNERNSFEQRQRSAKELYERDAGAAVAEAVRTENGDIRRQLRSVTAVAAEISGSQLVKLAKDARIGVITRDEAVSLVWSPYVEADAGMWRDAVNAKSLWDKPGVPAPQAPTVAVFDSGIDSAKTADFGGRVVARANFSSVEPNVTGDPNGHGTMVAGIVAGQSQKYGGVAPNAKLVDVRVASSTGEARTSDIVAAVDWVLANKSTYNIRVANFSLVGNGATSFRYDPFDKAVEKLWLSGITVVAAVGNNGSSTGPVGIGAPANDPFVITVGAIDQNGTQSTSDDFRAPWSAYGPTADGFMKPDVSAPGRWMVMPAVDNSLIERTKPWRVVAPGYMWMSGTSFASPVVAGAAAQLLARNPGWTPDQVKGAIMATAHYLASDDPGAGVGEVDISAAAAVSTPANPNQNLYSFVQNGSFNAEAWVSYVTTNSNWTQSNWTASNWTASNWVSSNWVASNWVASNWVSSNWTASNWVASNWTVATDTE